MEATKPDPESRSQPSEELLVENAIKMLVTHLVRPNRSEMPAQVIHRSSPPESLDDANRLSRYTVRLKRILAESMSKQHLLAELLYEYFNGEQPAKSITMAHLDSLELSEQELNFVQLYFLSAKPIQEVKKSLSLDDAAIAALKSTVKLKLLSKFRAPPQP